MRRYLAPSEVAKATIDAGIIKSKLSLIRMIILGVLAGAYIGFGGYGAVVITQTLGNIDAGLSRFMGAFVFPIGLMFVVIAGGELFTGNNLMTLALLDRKITLRSMLRNWFVVYFSNFLGVLLLCYGIYRGNLMINDTLKTTLNTALLKMSFSFEVAVIRGILCNILVVLAVWMGAAAQDIISRIFATWFPIMLFVLTGLEHCIANMFFLVLGKFLGLEASWIDIWIRNLIPVTIGNIIGGAIIIPFMYYFTYIHPAKSSNKEEQQ